MLNPQYNIPCVGAIIEREHNGNLQLLMQLRWKPERDPVYSGTMEFAIGKLDVLYEPIFDSLRREIKEETNLELESIVNDSRTKIYNPRDDSVIGFRPFCCTQQLKNGQPWITFIFRCRVKSGEFEITADNDEVQKLEWMLAADVKEMFEQHPEKLFSLELPAWEYYFAEVEV